MQILTLCKIILSETVDIMKLIRSILKKNILTGKHLYTEQKVLIVQTILLI